MTELEQLREEIAKLRERVAVLEARPVAPHYVPYPPPLYPPATWQPPYVVTCEGTAQ